MGESGRISPKIDISSIVHRTKSNVHIRTHTGNKRDFTLNHTFRNTNVYIHVRRIMNCHYLFKPECWYIPKLSAVAKERNMK